MRRVLAHRRIRLTLRPGLSRSFSGSGSAVAVAGASAAASSPPSSSSAAAESAAASSFPGVSGAAPPGVSASASSHASAPAPAPPALMVVMYTCRVCETRSARRVSRAAYERGSVLLRCPGCRGLHVLADHLGYFDDAAVDAAALLERRGERVRRGALPGPGAGAGGGGGNGGGGGADEHVVELTADDLRVLRAASKGVRLSDGAELPVVLMGPDVFGGEHAEKRAAEQAQAQAQAQPQAQPQAQQQPQQQAQAHLQAQPQAQDRRRATARAEGEDEALR